MKREDYPRIKGSKSGFASNARWVGAPARPGYQRPESPEDRKARLRRIAQGGK